MVRCGSFACSPPAASVQELARRSGVVFEGKLQEEKRAERNWTEAQGESPVNASRQVRVRVQQVWQLKAGGLLKDSVVSLIWFEGGRCFQLNTGIRYMFFMEATNDTSVFTAVFPPVETKRTVRKDVSQVLCQDCGKTLTTACWRFICSYAREFGSMTHSSKTKVELFCVLFCLLTVDLGADVELRDRYI